MLATIQKRPGMEAAGCIWEKMLCPRWTRYLTGELNPKLQKSFQFKNNRLIAITANNHTGRSFTTISKSASSKVPADAQKTAFPHNSKGGIKAQIHWCYSSACRLPGSCIHTVNSKHSAKAGSGAGITATLRVRKILTQVDSNTKPTGFDPSPHVCRSGLVLQIRFTHHQPLGRSRDPRHSQTGHSILLLAKSPHVKSLFLIPKYLVMQYFS